MKKASLFLTGLLLIGLSSISPIHAALDITVSPVFFNYSPKPGEIISDKVTIRNNTSSSVILDITTQKMTINQAGDVVPTDIASTDPLAKWFSYPKTKLSVPVREWVEVPFTISIPNDAAYGQYFAIVFSAGAEKTSSGAAVQGNVLVPVLLNVRKEGAIAKADIAEFSVANFVTEFLPVDFKLVIKNSGNIHLSPTGTIFIKRVGDTADLAKIQVNPGAGFILPGASREFTAKWDDGFAVRDQDGKLKFNWNKFTDFRFGKYTAYALLVYDDGVRDIPIESTTSFWVVPYTALIGGLATILIAIIIARFIFNSMVKQAAQKMVNSQ